MPCRISMLVLQPRMSTFTAPVCCVAVAEGVRVGEAVGVVVLSVGVLVTPVEVGVRDSIVAVNAVGVDGVGEMTIGVTVSMRGVGEAAGVDGT